MKWLDDQLSRKANWAQNRSHNQNYIRKDKQHKIETNQKKKEKKQKLAQNVNDIGIHSVRRVALIYAYVASTSSAPIDALTHVGSNNSWIVNVLLNIKSHKSKG